MSLENNIILGALGLLLFCTFRKHKDVVEHFNSGAPLRAKQVQVFRDKKTQQMFSVPQQPQSNSSVSQSMYMVPSNLQMNIPPRSAPADYGASIRYDPPAVSNRGTSMGSLEYSKTQIREGYTTPSRTYVGSTLPYSQHTIPSSDELKKETDKGVEKEAEKGHANEIGMFEDQAVPLSTFVFANQKSFLASQGDWIRGDPPIPPSPSMGWFNVAASTNDLRQGAMSVIGGVNNDTAKELMALKAASMGVKEAVGGGIKYTVEKSAFLSAQGGDINVKTTAFP